MSGEQCNGDITSDVTRYILLDINQKPTGRGPAGKPLTCGPAADEQLLCPQWHDLARTGERVFPSDTDRFPYDAYHYVGGSGRVGRRALTLSRGRVNENGGWTGFDHFSNPQEQDFIKLAPSAEWSPYGLPASAEAAAVHGWWEARVGAVTAKVPMEGTEPTHRVWTTSNIGPEMGIGGHSADVVDEWEVSGYDVLTSA